MHLLTLRTRTPLSLDHRPLVQQIVAEPAPAVAGLAARSWSDEDNRLTGRYLFADLASSRRYQSELDLDSVLPQVRSLGLVPPDVEENMPDRAAGILQRPIFIVSAPRAGSQLLFETLAGADSLWTVGGEGRGAIEGVPALHPAAHGYASHGLSETDADEQTAEALRQGYLAALRDRTGRRWLDLPADRRPARPRLLDKTPENSLRIPFLRRVFPDATFVVLHREVRPNVSSILNGWHHGGFVNLPRLPGWDRGPWCFLLPPGWRALTKASLSDVAAVQWRAANEHVLDSLDVMPNKSWTSVSYEDLVIGFPRVVRELLLRLEVNVDPVLADVLSRPPRLSRTTTTPPSPIKWRSNPHLEDGSFRRLGLVAGRLRTLTTTKEALRAAAKPVRAPVIPYACWLSTLDPTRQPQPPTPRLGDHAIIQTGVTVPLALVRQARHRERLAEGYPVVWVRDQGTGVLSPYHAERADAAYLRLMEPGLPLPPSTPERLVEELDRCGALATEEDTSEARVNAEATQLAEDRHTTLLAVLPPGQIRALGDYYQRLIESGDWELGDGQVAGRYGWHNEPMARFFHHQLTGLVSELAQVPVKPTYSYSSAYRAGAALKAHVDREQCDYTMSLLIDQSPEFAQHPWPLWFSTPQGHQSAILGLGDAVLFRGCELPHWREASPHAGRQTMLLFHYVSHSFSGVLE
jgi:Sulfotransferase family